MIAIINYEAGNLASVSNALERLDQDYLITDNPDELSKADGIIFPGVGHAAPAMKYLKENHLDQWLKDTSLPVLGICLGMQLFYESSEEGNAQGLGIIPGTLQKFESETQKVPHMGWNTFSDLKSHPLIDTFDTEKYFYYVHSFYAPVGEWTVASCNYINDFSAVVCRDNYWGVQFHPEKSGQAGSLLLQNFLHHVHGDSAKAIS